MWVDVYVVTAIIVAVAVWLLSPHLQSYDPPGDVTRGIWSAVAGALWPLVLVGTAQIYAVRYIARRLRPTVSDELDLAPAVALHEAGLRS
jgi:hypothetical protein